MSSRDAILARLRTGRRSPTVSTEGPDYRPMVPLNDRSPPALVERFARAAVAAGCDLHRVTGPNQALATVLSLLEGDTALSCWDPAHIPLPGLAEALEKAQILRRSQDPGVRVGLTGAQAALAATGSLVLLSGPGRYRATSLLPPVHVAVVTAEQIVPDLESWWAARQAAGVQQTRRHSNIVFVTGPSRTADIALEMVMGMHGPRQLHIILLER